jgi:hypothetical protein
LAGQVAGPPRALPLGAGGLRPGGNCGLHRQLVRAAALGGGMGGIAGREMAHLREKTEFVNDDLTKDGF